MTTQIKTEAGFLLGTVENKKLVLNWEANIYCDYIVPLDDQGVYARLKWFLSQYKDCTEFNYFRLYLFLKENRVVIDKAYPKRGDFLSTCPNVEIIDNTDYRPTFGYYWYNGEMYYTDIKPAWQYKRYMPDLEGCLGMISLNSNNEMVEVVFS